MDENPTEDDFEEPEKIIDDITDSLDEFHEDLTEGATIVGEEKERFEGLRPAWKKLSEQSSRDPDQDLLYIDGVRSLAAFRDELHDLIDGVGPITPSILEIAPSSDSTATITSSTTAFFIPGMKLPENLTIPRSDRSIGTIKALENIDPSLANTYRAIREVLYGTRSDPERGALYLIRQMFDHFFGTLAPDSEILNSPRWRPTDPEEPTKVTRQDRAVFVANKHVSNPAKKKRLLASTDHMSDVYRLLNKAHKRGEINSHEAREALREMHLLIEVWLMAFDQ